MVLNWKTALSRLGEKSLSTFVEAFLVALLAAWQVSGFEASAVEVAWFAALSAAITVVANGVPTLAVPENLPTSTQAVLRVIRTGVAVFLGYFAAMPVLELSANAAHAALLATAAALLAAIKAEVGRRIGNRDTVAWLPRQVDALRPAA